MATDLCDATGVLREAIRFTLTTATTPLSTVDIAERVRNFGASNAVVYNNLAALERAREVVRVPQNLPGGFVFWQLKPAADDDRDEAFTDWFVEWLAEIAGADDEVEWQRGALCAQTDPEAFFPDKGGSTREAKRVCQGCDVRAECLEYALSHDERFGIWGGLSERERRKLKKRAS